MTNITSDQSSLLTTDVRHYSVLLIECVSLNQLHRRIKEDIITDPVRPCYKFVTIFEKKIYFF